MGNDHQFVLFSAENQQFALPLHSIDRVLQIVKVEPIAKAPNYICGAINLEGDLIPVISLRKIFMLPIRDYNLTDQLVIFHSSLGRMALWVDSVLETLIRNVEDISSQDKLLLDVSCLDGILNFNDHIVLISDPDKFIEKDHILLLRQAVESLSRKINQPAHKNIPGNDNQEYHEA